MYYWQSGDITPYFSGDQFFISGDTVLNGMVYHKIWAKDIISTEVVFVPPYTLAETSKLSGLIREDTLARKVYSYSLEEEKEFLSYDFDLNIGDTLVLEYLDNEYIYVDTIHEVMLDNGLTSREFIFEGTFMQAGNDRYVEGIGGSSTLLFPFDYSFEFGADVHCVTQNGNSLFGDTNCSQLVGSTDLSDAMVHLYPNPVQGILNVTFSLTSITKLGFIIYSSTGQVVYGDLIEGLVFSTGMHGVSVDVIGWSPGLYYVKVFDVYDEKNLQIIPIIKQ